MFRFDRSMNESEKKRCLWQNVAIASGDRGGGGGGGGNIGLLFFPFFLSCPFCFFFFSFKPVQSTLSVHTSNGLMCFC